MTDLKPDYLTRTKALSLYNDGVCDASRYGNPWEKEELEIDGTHYTVCRRVIYGKGFAMEIFRNGKMVSGLMYLDGNIPYVDEWYGLERVYILNAIVFTGFTVACKVLTHMFPFWYKNMANMTGNGKYVAVQKGPHRNGELRRYMSEDVGGACMANDFTGLIPLYATREQKGYGLLAWGELYQLWMSDDYSAFS